ncbi:hypothetical protein [Azospirillum sp. TSO22-1]|uniref:hypothetical protein n=1 Tax=Azospirillum sp. TSO22-1 TaxID=716789 RepID=UPI000D603EAF|nr:hypothetical protein [Azospirillum sp. TSO22-1]PWC45782.1 hypothetical protein TSO221_15390 [Azospirillum sp. TSO22-1]
MTAGFSPLALSADDAVLSSATPTLLATLRDAQSTLADACRPIERSMLAVGERLGSAIDGLNRVTGAFERLPGELDSAEVRAASERLDEVAGALAAIAGTLGEERAALNTLAGMTRQIGARAQQLHKTVSAVGVLAINARIEAAHLATDREDFSVFTVEIGHLATKSGRAVQSFCEELDRLEALLLAASAHQAEFESSYAQQLRDASQQLRASLERVAEHRRAAARGAGEIGARTKAIGQGVASSVRALQIGDITRQRLEHVIHAVSTLADAAGGAEPPWYAPLSPEHRALLAATVCRLQSTQLTGAAGDFEREAGALTTSLHTLGTDGADIVSLGRGLYGTAHGRQSFLGDLTRDLAAADALIDASRGARRHVDEVASSAERTLTGLVAHVQAVRSIEMEMRLVGLNTAMKCGRLGNAGRTLSVIAQELRGYANRTVEDAQAVMTGLHEVVGMAGSLRDRGAQQGADRIAGLKDMVDGSIATLEVADQGLSAALAGLEREGQRVVALLNETAAGITAQRDLRRTCDAVAARLESEAAAREDSGADAGAIRDTLLALLEGQYTMASEREIHDLLFGPAAAQPVTAEALADTGGSLDDIFF